MGNTYSFRDVAASLVGPTGSANLAYGAGAADEGITLSPTGDKNTMVVGADGNVMHSLHADQSGVVTVRLLKTSPTNAILQAMYDAQQISSSLWGQNVITVEQKASGDISTNTSCAFKKKPEIKYGKDGDIMEWAFDTGRLQSFLGTY